MALHKVQSNDVFNFYCKFLQGFKKQVISKHIYINYHIIIGQ